MSSFAQVLVSALSRRPLKLIRVVVGVGCAIVLGLMWLNLIANQRAAEADEVGRIRQQARVHVRAAADTVQAEIDNFDFALHAARQAAMAGREALNMFGSIVTDAMPPQLVIQLFLIDASGYLQYSSLGPAPRNYLGDRDYFRTLAAAKNDRLVISDPVYGRLSNKWSIQFARGVWKADGEFMGVVALAVSPETWVTKLKSFEVEQSDVFAVLGADGSYLLRTLYADGYYGKRVPGDRPFLQHPEQMNGDFSVAGALDGVARMFAWIRLPSGLIVAMGIGLDEALAPVQALGRQSLLRTSLLSSLLVLASAALVLALGRYEKVVEKSRAREEHYRSVLDNMAEGIMIVDSDDRIIGVNPAFTGITGYGLDEVAGRNPALLSPKTPGARNLGELIGRYRSGSWEDDFDGVRWNGETYTGRATLSVVRAMDGRLTNRIVLLADVTERRRKDGEIWHQANFDSLTGLPNRALMMDRLERMISHARRQQSSVAVLFVDLDRFKPVNDNFGHEVGDRLLCEVARRLEALFREEDTVSRIGGDEFVVLLPRDFESAALEATAKKVVDRLSQPFGLGDDMIEISCCVGIARFPEDGDSASALIHKADVAMYRAKESGRSAWST
ncbi:diguanylate cyclase [Azoarcus sp. L1K30]|uniref:sensor domain-containing diguanylate cyclase n=1 Tax=Azoarcus sp. L1K30 TaxID=2820277 RepID=UPI001B827194|nr:diguanylate cyclase [Azoarcus sp. L1K30]MBR0567580.1 diguanylate cyclase [Azoarcus sp. L1K30]